MNRTIVYSIIVVLTTIFSSCERDNDHTGPSKIVVENYSDLDIDSIRISTASGMSWMFKTIGVYKGLESGGISDLKEVGNLEAALYFRAFLSGDSISKLWYFPNAYMDPPHRLNAPGRYYHFGIVECDTVNRGIMEIGLMDVFYGM
jgi:hypothetical protein